MHHVLNCWHNILLLCPWHGPYTSPHTIYVTFIYVTHIPIGTSPTRRGTGDKAGGCSWMGTRSATRSLAWPLEEEG